MKPGSVFERVERVNLVAFDGSGRSKTRIVENIRELKRRKCSEILNYGRISPAKRTVDLNWKIANYPIINISGSFLIGLACV